MAIRKNLWRAFGATLAAMLLAAPPLGAARQQARVYGKVVDETGQPVAGLQLTASDTQSDFAVTVETDEEGRYELILTDATREHRYRLEKKGYDLFETVYKVAAGSNSELNFTVVAAVGGGAPAVFNEGNEAARAGDLATAEAKYREALELDPGLAPAHAALAVVHFNQKQFAEAAAGAERALDLGLTAAAVHKIRYNAYKGLGDEERAAAALADLEAAAPEQAIGGRFNEAVAHFDAGRTAEARAALEQVLAADPEHARAHYYLGLCGVNTGDSELAREHLGRFLELAPDDPEAETARQMLEFVG